MKRREFIRITSNSGVDLQQVVLALELQLVAREIDRNHRLRACLRGLVDEIPEHMAPEVDRLTREP
jgi:hypothetical protein